MHLYHVHVRNKIYPSLGEMSHLKKCLVDPLSHCLVLAQGLARAVQKMPAERDCHSPVPPLGQQESLMHSKAQLRWRECCCCCCLLATQISKSLLLGELQLRLNVSVVVARWRQPSSPHLHRGWSYQQAAHCKYSYSMLNFMQMRR